MSTVISLMKLIVTCVEFTILMVLAGGFTGLIMCYFARHFSTPQPDDEQLYSSITLLFAAAGGIVGLFLGIASWTHS